jgi:hypothetical protein
MLTNDIKKGMRVQLKNGWEGTMMDNARGNTRMVEVEGNFTEIGSVYVWDIASVLPMNGVSDGVWIGVDLTEKQLKTMKTVKAVFG